MPRISETATTTADNVTLEVVDIGIHLTIELHLHRAALSIVEEVQLVLLGNLIPSY